MLSREPVIAAVGLSVLLGGSIAAQRQSDVVVLSELINEHAPYPSSHASTIAETTSGHLVAAWFGGSGEAHPDVGIWFARRREARWEPAVEVANGLQPDGTRYPTWNPVLFQAPKGPLFLFYKMGSSAKTWWGMSMTTTDDGRTWSRPRRLAEGIFGPMKDKPVVLPDGGWLSGSDTEDEAGWRVHFERSSDAGQTWTATPAVDSGAGFEAIQPTILFPGRGRIEALCRTKQGVVAMTWSRDAGRTWTPLAAAPLPNPNSGIDGVTLSDGRLLVYNHAAHNPEWSGHGSRYPLDIALSRDGLTWNHALMIENEADNPSATSIERPVGTPQERLDVINRGLSYPAVIQSSDGLVHITRLTGRQLSMWWWIHDVSSIALRERCFHRSGACMRGGPSNGSIAFVWAVLTQCADRPTSKGEPSERLCHNDSGRQLALLERGSSRRTGAFDLLVDPTRDHGELFVV